MDDTYFQHLPASARFGADAMVKIECRRSDRLLLGLNCLRPGQTQRTHAHADADKFYLVLRGRATLRVGDEVATVTDGALVWAPAGVPHGVVDTLEDTILVIGLAPAPAH